MRRLITAVVCLALSLSGLALNPANAAGTYNGTSGTVECSGGGTFTIASNAVTSNTNCAGNANIPYQVTTIDYHAFRDSTTLTSVTFESGSLLTLISSRAFLQATALTSVTLPASLVTISMDAFAYTSSLTTVTFPSNSHLYLIDEGAFWGSAIPAITIPASVEYIYNNAFAYTTALATVIFESGSNLRLIDSHVFEGSTALTKIVIPAGLFDLGGNAFKQASSLATVYFLGDAPYVGGGADTFENTANGARVCVTANATGFTSNVVSDKWFGLEYSGPCSVTYNANGATNGTVPTDTTPMYIVGESVTVRANSGGLEKSGSSFGGWNTQQDGLGTTYPASGSQTFTMGNSGVTLYAKWIVADNTITYDRNSSTSGTVPAVTTGSGSVTLRTNSGSLKRTGYTFAGWNTLQNGLGTNYAEGAAYTLNADVTLYAKWTPSETTKKKTLKLTVGFDSKSSTLSVKEKRRILRAIASKGSKVTSGTVVGYVQNDGIYTNNKALSADRAKAVAKFLADHGVKVRLVASGKGALNTNKSSRIAILTLRYVE